MAHPMTRGQLEESLAITRLWHRNRQSCCGVFLVRTENIKQVSCQIGTTVPAVSEKATLVSALNLVQQTEDLNRDKTKENVAPESENSSARQLSPICSRCPIRKVGMPSQARRTSSLPVNLDIYSQLRRSGFFVACKQTVKVVFSSTHGIVGICPSSYRTVKNMNVNRYCPYS